MKNKLLFTPPTGWPSHSREDPGPVLLLQRRGRLGRQVQDFRASGKPHQMVHHVHQGTGLFKTRPSANYAVSFLGRYRLTWQIC